MANCTYSLLGRVFNSELELDNFLLNNKYSIARGEVSDIVFSKRHSQSEALAILKSRQEEAERIQTIKDELIKVKRNKGHLSFEEEELIKPYRGVTSALAQFRTRNGDRLVSQFIEDNLRDKLFARWQDSGLSKEHAKLLGVPAEVPIVTDEAKRQTWENLKDAWKRLGSTGTAVHKVLEELWLGNLTEDQILDLDEVKGLIDHSVFLDIKAIKESIEHKIRNSSPALRNAKFIPEYPILADTTQVDEEGNPIKLLGIIDLVAVDENGNVHLFDYKTSDKDVDSWTSAKKVGFLNQVGVYKMAIDSYGLNTFGSDVGIIPLMLGNFDGRTGKIDSVSMHPTESIMNYRGDLHPNSKIMMNLRTIIVDHSEKPVASNDFINKITAQMQAIFPSYKFQTEFDEAVMRSIAAEAKLNPNTGKYELPDIYDRNAVVEFDESNQEEVLRKYHAERLSKDADSFRYYQNLIRRAMQDGDPSILSLEESKAHLAAAAESRQWFQVQFSPFCTGNGEWEMVDVPEFETLGIILMHNNVGGYYKVFILDSNDPNTPVPLKYGKSILGSFTDDLIPEQNGVTPLICDVGNINNIKAMLALNCFPEIIKDGEEIEGIYPICPRRQLGHHANAKQLTDNFRWLADRAGIPNNFGNGNLKFQNSINAAYQIIRECSIKEGASRSMNTILSKFENNGWFLEETLQNLLDAKKALEEQYPDLTQMTRDNRGPKINFSTPEGRAYARLNQGIAEIQNGFYTQQLRDGSKIKHLIDNPEIQDANLRNIYKLTTNYYETYRREMNALAAEFREMQQELWKSKGYTLAQRNMLNNERDLYKNMFEDNPSKSGRFRFKDPWDPSVKLEPGERAFLKKVIIKLAQLRNPEMSALEIETNRNAPDSKTLDVPLLRQKGSKNPFTKNGRKGIISWFKRSIDYIKNFRGNIRKGVADTLTSKDSDLAEQNAEQFKVFDTFESSDNSIKREQLLKDTDIDVFDHDIGNIFYMYAAAKVRKVQLDNYLPLLKAQLVQNMYEAALNNISIDNNVDYILKYTKAKIMDMSIVPEDYRVLAKALANVRSVATYLTLGFSPKSGLFQMMEGVWKNASRAGLKPLGPNQFGIKELRTACNWLLGDTKDHFKIVSLGELMNEWYGINDMDISSFARRLKEGQYPLTFAGKAMWLTSAPDYFNRMSIFLAQMIKDGCFEAHELDGVRMKYNWKKDKRFNLFANGINKGSEEYNKQKALYHTMMAQFQKEGYQIVDENRIKRDLQFDPSSDVPQDPIPQAYTNLEARNIKSLADQMYGYYNHEDQFLLKSMLLGASFTQFRTFWSSLKNRWYLKGGTYSNGHWEQAKDKDGQPMFKKFNVDSDGNLLSVELVPEDTGEPYMIWKGSYQEGYWQTIKESMLALFNPDDDRPLKERAISVIHGESGTENEDIIRTRAANLKLVAHDLLVWSILGLLIGGLLTKYLKEQAKADKSRQLSFGEMSLRHAESIFVSSLVSSTDDLGALNSLASPLTDWTPPSFRIMKNIWDDGCNVFTGDKSLTKAIVENVSVLRQTKNYWYKAEKMMDEM